MVNVHQHFLLIDAKMIRRSSSFESIPKVGGKAFKIKGSATMKNIGTDGQKPFCQTTLDIARSGRVVEERRQGEYVSQV